MRRLLRTLLLALWALFLPACATMGPPQPPSLELPKSPTDLKASRKGDKVTLTWTIPIRTTDRKLVRSVGTTRVCRGLEATLTQCGTPVGETMAHPSPASDKASRRKAAGLYEDTLPSEMESNDPAAVATYAIEVRNADGRSAGLSNQVHVPLLRTIPPPDLHATLTKDGVVLTWSSTMPRNVAKTDSQVRVRYAYRVYRRTADTEPWTLAGDFPAGGESDTTLTDSNIEWEKTYTYRIETVTVIARASSELSSKPSSEPSSEQQIEGDDSPQVKVFAHDVFPPAVPSELQAVFSGPGQKPFIDLIWAPVTDADLDGYNVYRHEEGLAPVKVNAALVKTPAYRDENVAAGKRYVYSVSAVDVRGNESARSEETGEGVP